MDRMPGRPEDGSSRPWLRSFRYQPKPAALSAVQWLIAQLVSCGLSDKEIAYILRICTSTVKAHNNKTLRSFGLVRRGQLVRYIFESGQFDPELAEALLAQRQSGATLVKWASSHASRE